MTLAEELDEVLFAHEPGLLTSDPPACRRAIGALAQVLGWVLATVLSRQGETYYVEALKAAMVQVDAVARQTAAEAERIRPDRRGVAPS